MHIGKLSNQLKLKLNKEADSQTPNLTLAVVLSDLNYRDKRFIWRLNNSIVGVKSEIEITISNCHFWWAHAIDSVTAGIYCFIEPMKNFLDFFSKRSVRCMPLQLWYKFVKLILIEFPGHVGSFKQRTENNKLMRMLSILHSIGFMRSHRSWSYVTSILHLWDTKRLVFLHSFKKWGQLNNFRQHNFYFPKSSFYSSTSNDDQNLKQKHGCSVLC